MTSQSQPRLLTALHRQLGLLRIENARLRRRGRGTLWRKARMLLKLRKICDEWKSASQSSRRPSLVEVCAVIQRVASNGVTETALKSSAVMSAIASSLVGSVPWAGAPTPRAAELEVVALYQEKTDPQMRGFWGVRGAEIEGGGRGQRHPKKRPSRSQLVAERVLVQSALSERRQCRGGASSGSRHSALEGKLDIMLARCCRAAAAATSVGSQ
jgi:hypothetical protein